MTMMSTKRAQTVLDSVLESVNQTNRLRDLVARIANYDLSATDELIDFLNRADDDMRELAARYPEAQGPSYFEEEAS